MITTSNYHTHTKRCGHAKGEDEEYVLEAIGSGYRNLGFSDHAMLPNFSQPYTRGDFSLFEDYCNSINELRKKYEGRINIYLGMEAESFPEYFPYFKELLSNNIIDYLILGNHFEIDSDENIVSHFGNITSASQLYRYRDLAISAISSKMYSIFAHPDFFMSSISNFDSDCKKISKDIIECCMLNDVPLEINMGGIRSGKKKIGDKVRWKYPTDDFFKLVSKYGAKCVYGMDAHAPDQLHNDQADFEAVKFAREHDLIILDGLSSIKKKD